MKYFSELEAGETPRTETELTANAWRGIAALIRARIEDGSFGAKYPETCTDGHEPYGTDEAGFWNALVGVNPKLDNPYQPPGRWILWSSEPPPILAVLDMVQFCWRSVGKPIRRDYHEYFKHRHLSFNEEVGREEFREEVNEIFRRNGLAYELTSKGKIRRLAPPVLRESLGTAVFTTRDPELDTMLETARRKFLDPDDAVRREALEKLWDAWERVKTVEPGPDKKAQVGVLLDKVAGSSSSLFRSVLENEAGALTKVGNDFMIRHSETTKEPLVSSDQVDYLFHRLFALIRLVLRTTGRGG